MKQKFTITYAEQKEKDCHEIRALLDMHKEILTKRSDRHIQKYLDHFIVARDEQGQIIGCIILQPLGFGVTYLRALAVHADYQQEGIGSRLIETCIRTAQTNGRRSLWGLVRKPSFLARFGFAPLTRTKWPQACALLFALSAAGFFADLRAMITMPLLIMQLELPPASNTAHTFVSPHAGKPIRPSPAASDVSSDKK